MELGLTFLRKTEMKLMKLLLAVLCLLSTTVTFAQDRANDYDEIIYAKNDLKEKVAATSSNTIIAKVTTAEIKPKAANLAYTKVIKDLPAEAIAFIKTFATRTNYVTYNYTQGKKFYPKINKEFAKLGVPTELNVLIGIESSFKKDIVSKSGAVGYWQFMDATAVEYGLNIKDSTKDDRKDIDKSTKAAAKYLKNHYKMFNDWYLTVASYNCGAGNVKKAIIKSGKTKPSFFEIKQYLPAETQNYVMKYIALNVL